MTDAESDRRTSRPNGYTKYSADFEGGWPRGPLGYEPRDSRNATAVAIGFCPRCGANARCTTNVRGVFNCRHCTYQWYDERVGEQTREISDYFSHA